MSKIEWTEKTWNPIVGCSIVSPGCTNCYAMRMAQRIERMGSAEHYRGLTKVVKGNAVWTGKMARAPEHILMEPLRVKRPTTWFVNSMSDLFHEDVPDAWIDQVFAVMALTPQHTYQVLTKRSARMREYLHHPWGADLKQGQTWEDVAYWRVATLAEEMDRERYVRGPIGGCDWWPLPNVWLGVSAERQQEANERVPDLLATPAAIRFVSAEPLLGPIDFTRLDVSDGIHRDALQGWRAVRTSPGHYEHAPHSPDTHLDWLIVGGESGPGARPFDAAWARSIVSQCKSAEVACFVKQVGSHPTDSDRPGLKGKRLITKSKKGGDMAEWPPELRVRQMPVVTDKAEAA